jgi:flagellar basal body rod protein FlgC
MIQAIGCATCGLASATARLDRGAARIAAAEPDVVGGTVDEITAKHDFAANVATVRTADEMLGSLIDIMA